MKYLVLLLTVLNSLSTFSQTQTLQNYSPDRAFDMCSNPNNIPYSTSTGFPCENNVATLYYLFKPAEDVQLGINASISLQRYIQSGVVPAPTSATFVLFGPFDPNEDYTSQVENNQSNIDFGFCSNLDVCTLSVFLEKDKHYVLKVLTACSDQPARIGITVNNVKLKCKDCESCIPKFQPNSGQYIVTGWVKETGTNTNSTAKRSYDKCHMWVIAGSTPTEIPVSGQIVDGWQRMEKEIPASSNGNFAIELKADPGAECYFDDIRVIPFDASMVSYVYDPTTMRLVAELDERNYAKIYEYDEEGKLIRVKKETEKGIMTIQENRENSSSKENE